MSYNRTWTSIGHVAGVSPAPLSRDNQAACSGVGRRGDRSEPAEVTRANSCGPSGWGRAVGLAGAGWGSQGPLEVSCGAVPRGPYVTAAQPPPLPVQLLFPDSEPEFIKLPDFHVYITSFNLPFPRGSGNPLCRPQIP